MTQRFTAAAAVAAAAFSMATVANATPTPISDLTILENSNMPDGSFVNITGIIVGDFRHHAADGNTWNGFHVQMTAEDATGVSGSTQSILVRDTVLGTPFYDLALEEGYEVRINNAVFNKDSGTNSLFGEANLQFNDEMTVEVLCSTPTVDVGVHAGTKLCKAVNVVDLVFPFDDSLDTNGNNIFFTGVRNMLMRTTSDLIVTDLYSLQQFNEVGLQAGGKRMSPTQMALPGAPAFAYEAESAKSSWILGKSEKVGYFQSPNLYPRGGFQDSEDPDVARVMRGGQALAPRVFDGTCVLMKSFGKWMSVPTKRGAEIVAAEILAYKPTDRVLSPATTPMEIATDGSKAILAIAGMNVENYFITFVGGRGAESQEQFTMQRNKIFRTLVVMNPAVAGLQEMENHAEDAALDDFIQGLNAYAIREGKDQIYTAVKTVTKMVGTDAIKNAIIYQSKYVTPVGDAAVLIYDSIEGLGERSRPSVAQTFVVNGLDSRFTIVSNHFKSKGSSGCAACSTYAAGADDVCTLERGGGCDKEDGQGFHSEARLASAKELYSEWLSKDPTGEQDKIAAYANRIISVGDMNSLRKEEAIEELMNSGIVNLADRDYNGDAISYVFSGSYGTLDYALATPAMAAICGKAADLETIEWNTNSDESGRIGYADQAIVTAGAADTVFRSSDHDPIVITCNMPGVASVLPEGETLISDLTASALPAGLKDGDLVTITGVVVSDFRQHKSDDEDSINGFHVQMTASSASGVSGSTQSILVRDTDMDSDFFTAPIEEGYQVQIANVTFNSATGPNSYKKEAHLEFNSTTTEITILCDELTWTAGAGIKLCAAVNIVELTFPLSTELDMYRNMLMRLPQEMTVTDLFSLYRSNEIGLQQGGKRISPTQVALPGADATAYQVESEKSAWIFGKSQVTNTYTFPNVYPEGGFVDNVDPMQANVIRGGQVMGPEFFDSTIILMKQGANEYNNYDDGQWQSVPTKRGIEIVNAQFNLYKPTDRVLVPELTPMEVATDGSSAIIAVSGMNVENYFIDLVNGRGAKTQEQFTMQRNKIFRTLIKMNPAVAGLQEMENHAEDAALDDFIQGLNAYAIKEGKDQIYTAVKTVTTMVGGDVIKNAIIYQSKYVTPVGDAAVLEYDSVAGLGERTRPSVAQTFEVNGVTGSRFTLISNHFKSKGSSGCSACSTYAADADDVCLLDQQGGCDQEDGQGFWARARLTSANELYDEWLSKDPTGEQNKVAEFANRIISVGDMNSNKMENTITALIAKGIVNLADRDYNGEALSYQFSGAYSTLDYALATPAMAAVCGKAVNLETVEWNTNSDESAAIGYSDGDRDAPGVHIGAADTVFRSSDHDPIVITCNLGNAVTGAPTKTPTQAPTVTMQPTVSPTKLQTGTPGTGENTDEIEETDETANDVGLFIGGMALMAALAGCAFLLYTGKLAAFFGGESVSEARVVSNGPHNEGVKESVNNPRFEQV